MINTSSSKRSRSCERLTQTAVVEKFTEINQRLEISATAPIFWSWYGQQIPAVLTRHQDPCL